jgi:parvulin-like peptidyl-prolyl isomerase
MASRDGCSEQPENSCRRIDILRVVKSPLKFFLCLALLFALAGTACAQTFGNTAAVVNGHRVSQKQLQAELPIVKASQTGQTLSVEEATRQALIAAIENELFLEVAKQRKIVPTKAAIDKRLQDLRGQFQDEATFQQQVKTAGYTMSTLRSDFLFNNLITQSLQTQLAPPVTAEQVQAVYTAQREQFRQVMVEHILFQVGSTKTDAQALKQANDALAQLKVGADFAALAKKLSDDQGSKANGGKIDQWLTVSDPNLDQAFAAAAWAAPIGKVTGPVKSSFGYHIIVTLKKRIQPLSEVEATIRQTLENQVGTRAITDFVTALVKKATIVVNPRYGDWDAATQSITAHQFFRPAPGESPSPTPSVSSFPLPTASP